MKTRWPILIFIIVLSQMISCDTENSFDGESDFTSDTLVVLNYFDEVRFENDTLPKLLTEIGICDALSNESATKDDCSPRNYKFFKFNKSMPWNEGFGLEVRATVDDFPLRRFIIFERTGSTLVKTRGFVANLAEMHTTPTGFNDLMLLFPDREAGSFVVKFVYDLEN